MIRRGDANDVPFLRDMLSRHQITISQRLVLEELIPQVSACAGAVARPTPATAASATSEVRKRDEIFMRTLSFVKTIDGESRWLPA